MEMTETRYALLSLSPSPLLLLILQSSVGHFTQTQKLSLT